MTKPLTHCSTSLLKRVPKNKKPTSGSLEGRLQSIIFEYGGCFALNPELFQRLILKRVWRHIAGYVISAAYALFIHNQQPAVNQRDHGYAQCFVFAAAQVGDQVRITQ